MSYHVLHVLNHDVWLHKDRGRLKCEGKEVRTRSIPIADVKAVVIAARGVRISSELFSALLENDTVILHCDSSYRPIGETASLHRTVDGALLEAQLHIAEPFRRRLWHEIVRGKIMNQKAVLDRLGCGERLMPAIHRISSPDIEALASRLYWRHFFSSLKAKVGFLKHERDTKRVTRNSANGVSGPLNSALNYGYAVLSALLHRSVVIHGLNPCIGIHHKYRYRNAPLVHDLIEPFRAIVDEMLIAYSAANPIPEGAEETWFEGWAHHIGEQLKGYKVRTLVPVSLKLVDYIDFYVRSFCGSLALANPKLIKCPSL